MASEGPHFEPNPKSPLPLLTSATLPGPVICGMRATFLVCLGLLEWFSDAPGR